MRFLVDTQLPRALARFLVEKGHDAEHVLSLGLEKAPDREIWTWARQNGAIIVTKDEDFVVLQRLEPDGPAVLWLRLGNATNRVLFAWLEPLLPSILAALESGERLVEVLERGT